jgi:hypothetical protein
MPMEVPILILLLGTRDACGHRRRCSSNTELPPRRQSPRSNSLIFVQSFWRVFARALVGLLFNIPAGHPMPQLLLEKKKRTITVKYN